MPQTKIIDGMRYRRYVKICAAGTGTDRSITEHWLAEITPKELADNAWDKVIANVPKPSFGSAPPSSNAIVKYDMWLWTDPAQYVPVTAQASVQTFAGRVTATVTAEPIRLVFSPGEPDSQDVICAGPGRAWQPSDGELTPSDCMYTYQHSSEITDTDVFDARWSIVWRVTWASNSGGGGTLDEAFVTTTELPMTVREVQTIIVE